MAQPMAVNDVLAVVVEGMNEGRPWAMIRHYIATAVASAANLSYLLEQKFEVNILTTMAAELTDKWQAECISVHRVAPSPRDVDFYPITGGPIVGSVATDGTPNDNAVLLTLRTDEPGARNRGRVYVPGLPEASTNAGLLLSTKQVAWDAIALLFTQGVSGGGDAASPVIFSRTSYGGPGDTHPASVADYTSGISLAKVAGNLASMRRRRYRRNVFG